MLRNLNLFVYNDVGSSILGIAASQPAGSTESLAGIPLTAGTYHIRVGASSFDQIQMYRLEITIVDDGTVATAAQVGTGCGGLTWTDLTTPLIGGNQISRLDNIPNPASSIVLLLLGFTDIPGGLDLGFLGAPTCTLYVDTISIQTIFPTSSFYVWLFQIPNTPSVSGAQIWTQAGLLVPPGTNALGIITANTIELTLGTQ